MCIILIDGILLPYYVYNQQEIQKLTVLNQLSLLDKVKWNQKKLY